MAWTKAAKAAHSLRMKAKWAERRASNKTRSKQEALHAKVVKREREEAANMEFSAEAFLAQVQTAPDKDLKFMHRVLELERTFREASHA